MGARMAIWHCGQDRTARRTGRGAMGWAVRIACVGWVLACSGCAAYSLPFMGERMARDQPVQAAVAPSALVRCESRDNRRHYCPVETDGGVRLAHQLSSARCVQGSSWGFDARGIWVARGCSAEFATGAVDAGLSEGPALAEQLVRCESRGTRRQRCNAAVQDGVRLKRQLSTTRCVQRQNWGWDRSGVWVDGGCSAEFAVR